MLCEVFRPNKATFLSTEEEDDGMVKLRLTLDAVPPVDPKFGVELQEQLQKMSTAELLEAYAANAAAAHLYFFLGWFL